MLQIIPSSQVSEYQCRDKPVVQITHQFQTEQLADLLRIAVKTLGQDEVNALIGYEPKGDYGYMVFVDGGAAPRHTHSTYQTAVTEAKRLAHQTGRTATVMKKLGEAIAVTQPTTVQFQEFKR